MKITILQGAFLPVPPLLGGAVEKMWFALGKEFVNLGHQVTQISRLYSDLPKEEWIDGVLHKRIPGYSTPRSGAYLKWLDLKYTLKAKSIIPIETDIIITNTFWAPIILSPSHRKKCVPDVARMPKGQMRFYRNAPRLRANSSPVAEEICKELTTDQHKRVVMIPNPLPFQHLPDVNRNRKEKVLLYTGRIHPEKGLDILIKAFKELEGDWKLKIVGPAEVHAGGGGKNYLESLKRIAPNLNIEFTGPIYDIDQLNTLYSQASIFVYPSVAEKGETFGLAPLEAMAWGCIPIVSDLACFRDFIKHEHNGLIFNHRTVNAHLLLANAIQKVQSNDVIRDKLSEEAIKVRHTHSVSFIASLFLEEFERINIESN